MIKLFTIRILLIISLLILNSSVLAAQEQMLSESKVPQKCVKEANPNLGFFPKAITLTSVNVRSQMPEYSFIKGQWILGQYTDTLSPNTCLAVLEKKIVGVIQVWFYVRYKKGAELRSGWIWGGTKDVDENKYIGGDTTPEKPGDKHVSLEEPLWISPSTFFSGLAYAQADFPPENKVGQEVRTNPGLSEVKEEKTLEYYVKIPLLGWTMSVGSISAAVLFLFMVLGMFAKAIWDQTESGNVIPPFAKILRPFLISPIAFSAFWGPMYIQQGSAGLSLTMALYAFQIGFMWQHILEKRLSTGPEEKKQ